ncbi:MAG: bacillithiol biosynthesis deacetylase BshB1 [Candidatus Kapaibacterium sp.]|nr:MAG: bacillithiol biosynthesis deacetylase BshB1 [Candidatus Kapabacteria bacterium]
MDSYHHIVSADRIFQAETEREDVSSLLPPPVHALVITAHPDDAELSCGGVILQMTGEGKRVAVVECTRGEMGSRGTPEIRRNEALEAAKILDLTERWNLNLPDGNIAQTPENIAAIVAAIRYFRPNILLFNPPHERHIDHENVHRLTRTAVFQSGLAKLEVEVFGMKLPPYRPKRLFCYMQTYEFEPTFYVDISAHFEGKLRSIFAHASQVFVPSEAKKAGEQATVQEDANTPQTLISSPEFYEFLKARARHFGGKIGVQYAEGFLSIEPLGFRSMSEMLG